jgi:hypothetical protein
MAVSATVSKNGLLDRFGPRRRFEDKRGKLPALREDRRLQRKNGRGSDTDRGDEGISSEHAQQYTAMEATEPGMQMD